MLLALPSETESPEGNSTEANAVLVVRSSYRVSGLPKRSNSLWQDQQSTDVVVTTYTGCDDDVPMVFYVVIDGGHAWPSSPLTEPGSPMAETLFEIQGYSTFEIDATVDGWEFLSQHSLEV